MTFWQFVFSFLYTRNWYNGQLELSRPKVALFAAGLCLLVLGCFLVSVMQAPVVYEIPV